MAKNSKKSNDLAIMGLVFAIFQGLPGVILSIMGLSQIKKTGESGKGFAIAGIIIGVLNMLFVAVLVVLFILLIISDELYLNDYTPGVETMTTYEKCNSIYTECDKSDWYCEEYGCYCTYDDGEDYDYFYCASYNFD